jgi:phage shock protein PspC (stress-responsive transcriptional regulator)
VTREEVLDLGRLRRNVVDSKVGGVAGGLARHFDIDPVIVRVLFVVTGLFGVGLVAYAALWALLPADNAAKAPIGLDESTRTVAIIVLAVLTALALIGMVGDPDMGGIVFLGLLALGGVVLVKSRERNSAGHAPQPVYAGAPGPTATDGGSTGVPAVGTTLGGAPQGYDPPPAGYQDPRWGNPRKRGPLLFGVTVALLLFSLGLLGTADVAGVEIPPSAYPALAVSIIGLMLIIGAWYGRAGGLIALGLAATLVLAAGTGAENFDGDRRVAPTSADQVRDNYDIGAGELLLDLSDLSDPAALAGRTISLHGGIGHIIVVVPEDVDARVDAAVDGPGNIKILGTDLGGVETRQSWLHDTAGTGLVTIDVELGVGEIEVRTS